MPNLIGFAQIHSQGTKSVYKELWDSNRQEGISRSTEGNWGENSLSLNSHHFPPKVENKHISPLMNEWMIVVLGHDSALLRLYWAGDNLGEHITLMLWVLAIYNYISSFMQIQKTVLDLLGFNEKWISN